MSTTMQTEYYAMPELEANEPVAVVLDDIVEGYRLHPDGVVISPQGKEVQWQKIGLQYYVSLKRSDKAGLSRTWRVDRMVLIHFGEPPKGAILHPVHADGDPTNCHIANLRWGTSGEARAALNPALKAAKGTKSKTTKTKAPKAAPKAAVAKTKDASEVEVLRVYRSGKVQMTVNPDGSGVLEVGQYVMKVSKDEVRALTLVMGRVQEFSTLIG